jgi:hypothetical protein
MKKRLWTLFMLLLMVLGSFFFAFKPAAAQTGTTVFFSPDPANVYLNGTNSQVMEVWVGNVVELNGFDITMEYDPIITTLQSWAIGNFLESVSCSTPPGWSDSPGHFRRYCIQIGRPLKTGSGILLRFTFNGLSHGSSELTFVNPQLAVGYPATRIIPIATNGTLNVTYNATIKPTTLSGSFDLQGRSNRGGIPIRLSVGQYVGQGPYTVPTTNVSGNNLAFTNVAMDVYTVSTSQARYLNITPAMGKQIALLASGNVLPPLRLLGGNAVWTNNEIDIFDVALVSGEIGKTSFNADADINNDGKVDIFDLALVAGNYGITSTIAYADWLP